MIALIQEQKIADFHQLIRAGNVEKMRQMLADSPELCYLKDDVTGKFAIHVAAESSNDAAVKALFEAEDKLPTNTQYELSSIGLLPVVFQRIKQNEAGAQPDKKQLDIIIASLDPRDHAAVEIKELLERREEKALSELLAQIRGDAGCGPYTRQQLEELARRDTPYSQSSLTTTAGVNITLLLDSHSRVVNVPLLEQDERKQLPVKGVDGVTPLHVAALAGDGAITERILQDNTDPREKNASGLTAADMSEISSRAEARSGNKEKAAEHAAVTKTLRAAEKQAAQAEAPKERRFVDKLGAQLAGSGGHGHGH